MNQLHLINVLVAVVETNGFASAARKLGMSAPAVTRAINELESYLGQRLLTRTTRAVSVTEPGTRYAQDCRRILADLSEANESIVGMHKTPRGRLGLAAPMLFGSRFMSPIVTEYLQRFETVSATCNFVDREVDLMVEGMDIAVHIGHLPDSSMQAICVGHVGHVICAAPSYLEKHGAPTVLNDLALHSIVAPGGVGSTHEWQMVEEGVPRTMRLQPRMLTTTNDGAISAALMGFGLTRMLTFEVDDHLRDGRLEAVLSGFEPAPLPVQLLHREGRHAAPKTRAFLDLAIERLRADPALNEHAVECRAIKRGEMPTREALRDRDVRRPKNLATMGVLAAV